MPSIKTSLPHLGSHIDHSLLHPTLTTPLITKGIHLAISTRCAAICLTPSSLTLAKSILSSQSSTTTNSLPAICTVIAFPHGTASSYAKISETIDALKNGATEIDLVVNISKVLSHEWDYVDTEIEAIQRLCTASGAILKVIFENDYLSDEEIVELCRICTRHKVAYVKTSTGFGFKKDPATGGYGYDGATVRQVKLMKENVGEGVKVKAAGAVRSLDAFLEMISLGVERVGLSATAEILDEAKRRGVGEEETEVEFHVKA